MPRSSNSWPGLGEVDDRCRAAGATTRAAGGPIERDRARSRRRRRPCSAARCATSLISDRYFDSAPTVGLMLISLSLSTISSWRLAVADVVERLERQARHAAPRRRRRPRSARSACRGRRAPARGPRAIDRPVPGVAAVEHVVRATRVRRGKPPMPSIWRSVSKRSSRPVSSLWAYAWWPVSHTIRSRGDSSSRWSASVSSTTPSERPRWPPVVGDGADDRLAELAGELRRARRRTGRGGRRAPGGGRGSARAGAPGSAGCCSDGPAADGMRRCGVMADQCAI